MCAAALGLKCCHGACLTHTDLPCTWYLLSTSSSVSVGAPRAVQHLADLCRVMTQSQQRLVNHWPTAIAAGLHAGIAQSDQALSTQPWGATAAADWGLATGGRPSDAP
jgi:hypothetical protein